MKKNITKNNKSSIPGKQLKLLTNKWPKEAKKTGKNPIDRNKSGKKLIPWWTNGVFGLLEQMNMTIGLPISTL